jgi:vancomycin permeability regulator SanA
MVPRLLFHILMMIGRPGLATLITGLYARPKTFPSRMYRPHGSRVQGRGRDGSPTPVLRDRVAARLYFAGKAEKLIMSGGNPTIDYDEPGAMRAYALSLGVPD